MKGEVENNHKFRQSKPNGSSKEALLKVAFLYVKDTFVGFRNELETQDPRYK
jgi:hypothetical protein